jgi:hypothetical protein
MLKILSGAGIRNYPARAVEDVVARRRNRSSTLGKLRSTRGFSPDEQDENFRFWMRFCE